MMDKLFINGKIYTMEKEGEFFQALGVKDGIISFLGTNEEAKELESKEIIDLEGKVMVPGMADSHMHMYAYCQNQTFVDLSEVKSIEEMITVMTERAKVSAPGTWIKGVNFDQSKWIENRFPTRHELDRISTEHPVLIRRCCLHAVVVNTKALEIAKVGKGYCGGTGGIVETEEDGMPNGILREQSTKVFDEILPDPFLDTDLRKEIFSDVMKDMASKGITTIHTYAAKIWKYNEDVEIYKEFEKQNQLPIRVTVCIDEIFEPEVLTEEQKKDPNRKVQYGAYKIFSDGSMGSRSAALNEPYSDDPENLGFVICSQEELINTVLNSYEKGLQPAIHAIGDRALDMTLTAIEETLRITREKGMTEEEQKQRLPFRIIHVQMVDEKTIERMKKLPLILDIQPIFLNTDLHWIEDRIGKERARGSFALKSMADNGLIITGGSDCPVETYDPIKGIHMAVNRRDFEGYPEEGFYADEKLSPYEAMLMYTKNVHYATGQEEFLGTLSKGKFADLAVLDRDIFEIPEEDIKNIKVERTYIAGENTFVLE
ncbi:MAG: amidohydrolase [Eubacteriales bacterium]|nr:amidohydrolase [Eubacteriales bacterium]